MSSNDNFFVQIPLYDCASNVIGTELVRFRKILTIQVNDTFTKPTVNRSSSGSYLSMSRNHSDMLMKAYEHYRSAGNGAVTICVLEEIPVHLPQMDDYMLREHNYLRSFIR